MPLPALIQRLWRRSADAPEAGGEGGGAGEAGRAPPDAVTAARTLARRRLIGASVLLALAVGVFSLVFESRPRPLPLDTPIELAGRTPGAPAGGGGVVKPVTPLPSAAASAPAASAPGPQSVPEPVEPVAEAPATTPAQAPAAAAPAPVVPKEPAPARAASAPTAPKTAAAVPKTAPPAPPPAAAAPAQAAASRPAAAEGRFVVQVGAFAEAAQVRELRARLDKLGLRPHYVQAIEAKGGQRVNRVRLGPYAKRDEAERAAGRLKDAGLPGQVLEL